ncbi:hypothetical protein KI688_009524 [Linnemannia hyalina]|uniref:Uncharacterized protein n=1 Tax=Linnemannia hyalina TaxID=64524 RepID=A0A9P7Y106_9FUNG|nr:hypothetical protein KI688_009524 [Linnemannia hyalina]
MLGQQQQQQQQQQRFNQKSSDRWLDREERDPGFNIMSPTGRNRPFKGIHMPRNVHWDGPQAMIGNTVSNGWSRGEGIFGAPQSTDGISYVYHKGPAGQTPFPTLIAMPGYFPQGTQPPTQQQQCPTQPTAQSNGGPQPSNAGAQQQRQRQHQHTTPYPSPPAHINEDDKGLDFWKGAYPRHSPSHLATAAVTAIGPDN